MIQLQLDTEIQCSRKGLRYHNCLYSCEQLYPKIMDMSKMDDDDDEWIVDYYYQYGNYYFTQYLYVSRIFYLLHNWKKLTVYILQQNQSKHIQLSLKIKIYIHIHISDTIALLHHDTLLLFFYIVIKRLLIKYLSSKYL